MKISTLQSGQELKGENIIYRIESVLGQGSFGITYKAKAFTLMKGKFGEELVETNTPRTIKEFFMKEVNERDESGSITGMSEGSLSYNYAQKFKKEAENLASMSHPNIVKVIDFISANNTYYYVMDFIEGENLNDYLKYHKMTEQEATNTIKEVAKALKYMHEEKHMLHLDLKPGNIMRRKSDGHIVLIDFGLSKHYNEEGLPETSTSIGLGTSGYAPIEQANSKNSKQFKSTLDVYALGATFYKLLTSQTPPSADELVDDEEHIKTELTKHGINNTLVNVIVHAMMPRVRYRTQNVNEFLKDLCSGEDNPKDGVYSQTEEATLIVDLSPLPEDLLSNGTVEDVDGKEFNFQKKIEVQSKEGFVNSWKQFIQNIFNFKGYSTRANFWYVIPFLLTIQIGLLRLSLYLPWDIFLKVYMISPEKAITVAIIWFLLISSLAVLPVLSLEARRLRDAGYSPYLLLFTHLPVLLCICEFLNSELLYIIRYISIIPFLFLISCYCKKSKRHY